MFSGSVNMNGQFMNSCLFLTIALRLFYIGDTGDIVVGQPFLFTGNLTCLSAQKARNTRVSASY